MILLFWASILTGVILGFDDDQKLKILLIKKVINKKGDFQYAIKLRKELSKGFRLTTNQSGGPYTYTLYNAINGNIVTTFNSPALTQQLRQFIC